MSEISDSDKLGAIHHYVPQGYLRRFSVPAKTNQIIAYETGKHPYKTNIHNVAGQRNFYSFTDINSKKPNSSLEDALADIDFAGLEVLRKLDDMQDGHIDLLDETRGELLMYVAFQHVRNLQERKMWATSFSQSASIYMQAAASNKDGYHSIAKEALGDQYNFETAESSRKSFLNAKVEISFDPLDDYFLRPSLDMAETLYRILFTEKSIVLVTKTEEATPFVTSDNPVTHYLTEEQRMRRHPFFRGTGYIDAVFQLPISPSRCLLLINKDMVMQSLKYDQDAVNYINWHTYHFADRWVFSSELSNTTKVHFEKFKRTSPLTSIESPFGPA